MRPKRPPARTHKMKNPSPMKTDMIPTPTDQTIDHHSIGVAKNVPPDGPLRGR
jgi:hypothetical protein